MAIPDSTDWVRPLAALLGSPQLAEGSLPHACVEFKENKLGNDGKDTQDAYRRYLDVIADEFEEFRASQMTTKNCAGFLRDNFKNTPNTAKKYAALMGRLFKFITGELGLRQDKPIDQLDMYSAFFFKLLRETPTQRKNPAPILYKRIIYSTGFLYSLRCNSLNLMVGARRFELPTPCTPCMYATRLRYAPTRWEL